MLKNTYCFCFALLFCLFIPERGAAQEVVADKVVAVVGNSAILYSEVDALSRQVIQQRRERGYTSDRDPINEALEQLLLQKLLFTQAQIDSVEINSGDLEMMAEERVQEMAADAGGIMQLQALYHKPVFDIREDIRREMEEMRYAQAMHSQIVGKVKITPGEVERFYRSIDRDSLPIVPEQYVYAQIVKYPKSTREAHQRTKERLLEMRERIVNGARFDMLARMYSMDPGTAMRGGEMDPTPLEGLEKPFADALAKLNPGQISEVVETVYGLHIIQMIDKRGNKYSFRHILLRPSYLESELAASDKTLDSLVRLIRLDSLTFQQAALDFSDDPYSRQNGGVVSNHDLLELYNAYDPKYTTTRFLKEELTREDYNALRQLRVGDISDAYRTMDLKQNELSKVVKLLDIIPSHSASLSNDYLRLEEMAFRNKQEEEFERWLDKKIESMYIRIEPEFRNGAFENENWVK